MYFASESVNSKPGTWCVLKSAAIMGCMALLFFWPSLLSAQNSAAFNETDRSPSPSAPISNTETRLDVPELLAQLDSVKYLQRESATLQLAALGAQALKPMAVHYLDSSPESSWRIRSSLEKIAISGNESTFLKAAALLQLLVGHENAEVRAQLTRLKIEWSNRQTELAVNRLKQAGAVVENFSPEIQKLAMQRMASQPNYVSSTATAPPQNRTRAEQLDLIDKIMDGSLAQNRKLVLGSGLTDQKQKSGTENPFGQVRIDAGMALFNRSIQSNKPPVVKIGSAWNGNKAAFRELENVIGLSKVVFEKQTIDRSKLETLKRLNELSAVEFNKCRFSGPALATIGLPTSIDSIAFRNQDIEVSTIDRIQKLDIRSLTFDRCDFSRTALLKMLSLQSLSQLELAQTELDAAAFARIEKMKRLRALRLSGCKFPYLAYKRLTRERPEIFIDFTTTAFLGVRSVPGVSNVCQISDVVTDSGAQRGGVLPQDIIASVNGQPIQNFNDLRAQIALHKNGDTLALEVVRQQKKVKLSVTLGDFADAPEQ